MTVAPHRRLLAAARRGDTDAVRAALADGARTETRDEELRSPLLLAVLGDHVDTARALVAAGADVHARDARHDSPWLATGATGSVAMLRVLLTADPAPDVRLTDRFGATSLIAAAERGHVPYVRAVLRDTPTDVDHVDDLGWTALLQAVILGDGGPAHQKVVALLLAAGADPSLADAHGTTALEHAERRGHTALAALLRRTSAAPATRA
ncbi:ankyrin repeat domain-containing protein [Streptomyces roseofulvus]|uniref:Ankyrin repeat domain-containing protein n=2 Tax=Streptomyces TaxID=1883 RepID=A0ABU4KGJ9_9ACTN|nr:ankyrin repeat domain-containing protein [Streptomyces roseolus]MDX2296918.1 ankyrin repeat domain-containing protein [Streptomyces roseolus]